MPNTLPKRIALFVKATEFETAQVGSQLSKNGKTYAVFDKKVMKNGRGYLVVELV